MIQLTRFNGVKFYLNATHVETVESTPDTVITLLTGKKYIVRETAEEVRSQILHFYQQAFPAFTPPRKPDDDSIE
ncbi:flagellar FlbD family protein [Brevibacillus ruminantium]|uniref:Flagellar FlbD family protein n=1 Tax=Brevibacillus ruminantium TaxID=2950604 RepID=A0ABY4WLC1_9BACL|nr:flagellar FlbD family protein [Brevibacillus ruminantium]USG67932.1 flagellar FlbD family protein [Brevibacillus ruminantium]